MQTRSPALDCTWAPHDAATYEQTVAELGAVESVSCLVDDVCLACAPGFRPGGQARLTALLEPVVPGLPSV